MNKEVKSATNGRGTAHNRRAIVGVWQTRADWEAWHADPKFRETRQQMEGLEAAAAQEWWHEVVADLRAAA